MLKNILFLKLFKIGQIFITEKAFRYFILLFFLIKFFLHNPRQFSPLLLFKRANLKFFHHLNTRNCIWWMCHGFGHFDNQIEPVRYFWSRIFTKQPSPLPVRAEMPGNIMLRTIHPKTRCVELWRRVRWILTLQ